MRTTALGAAALGLYAVSAAIAPGCGDGIAGWVRDATRPLILPTLWASLEGSERAGLTGETVAKARLVLRFLPDWDDGDVYFASLLALGLSRETDDANASVDRILTALSWLDERRVEVESLSPERAAEILMAQSFFVESRISDDPEFESAFRRRLGHDGMTLAKSYLERAHELNPTQTGLSRQVFFSKLWIRAALARDDIDTAIARATSALADADRLEQQDEVVRLLTAALRQLISHLRDGVEIDETDIERNRFLGELLGKR